MAWHHMIFASPHIPSHSIAPQPTHCLLHVIDVEPSACPLAIRAYLRCIVPALYGAWLTPASSTVYRLHPQIGLIASKIKFIVHHSLHHCP